MKTMRLLIAISFFVSFSIIPQILFSQPGQLDPNFKDSGKTTYQYTTGNEAGQRVVELPNKRLLIAGSGWVDSIFREIPILFKLKADGELDSSYGINGYVEFPIIQNHVYVLDMEVDPLSHKTFVAGRVGNNSMGWDFFIAAVDTFGNIDSLNFGLNGIVTIDFGDQDWLTNIEIQKDGKIILGGAIKNFYFPAPDTTRFGFCRITQNGSLDSTFGNQGFFFYDYPSSSNDHLSDFKILPSGKIICLGFVKDQNWLDLNALSG
jgi:uncharacterized delta-60 repeat protein